MSLGSDERETEREIERAKRAEEIWEEDDDFYGALNRAELRAVMSRIRDNGDGTCTILSSHPSWLEPEKQPTFSDPVAMEDGTVLVPKLKRGSVLKEAINTINGERQDVYGSPEDSFALIGEYWSTYLDAFGVGHCNDDGSISKIKLSRKEVAMMMTLFKIAREANQHKRDNIVDAAGYLGIYADMQGAE